MAGRSMDASARPSSVGWLRDLTVGKLMRREMRTVRADTRLSAFRRDFPPGSAERMVALDDAGRYAGPVSVAEAHLETLGAERVADLLRLADRVLLGGFKWSSQRLGREDCDGGSAAL